MGTFLIVRNGEHPRNKRVRNAVNRLVNCDTANLNKTINASMRQVENIKYIEQKIGLKTIKAFAEIAELRLQHRM